MLIVIRPRRLDFGRSLSQIVNGWSEESQVDYVGLWQIASAMRRRLGARTTDEARKLSLELFDAYTRKDYDPGIIGEAISTIGRTKNCSRHRIAAGMGQGQCGPQSRRADMLVRISPRVRLAYGLPQPGSWSPQI